MKQPTEQNVTFGVEAFRLTRGASYSAALYGCTDLTRIGIEQKRAFRAGVEFAVKWYAENMKESESLR